jgi:hypothetical protein
MDNKESKKVVFCGVMNFSDGTPANMSKEEIETFTKMCSNNGEFNAIYCEDMSIPTMMTALALIKQQDEPK